MRENKIHSIGVVEATNIAHTARTSFLTHLVELNGQEIQSWDEYIVKIEDAFKIPTKWTNNIDAYNDWMRDLDWLQKDEYVLIIYSYTEFLKSDCTLKNIIMNGFENLILPWWQEEVKQCVVDGEKKSFNVYLVD